jgi:hypothetical protein
VTACDKVRLHYHPLLLGRLPIGSAPLFEEASLLLHHGGSCVHPLLFELPAALCGCRLQLRLLVLPFFPLHFLFFFVIIFPLLLFILLLVVVRTRSGGRGGAE